MVTSPNMSGQNECASNVHHSYGHVPSNSALIHIMNLSPCHVPTYAMSFLFLSKYPKFPGSHSHTSNKKVIPLQRKMALNQIPDVDYPLFWELNRRVSECELRAWGWVYMISKVFFPSSNAPELWFTRVLEAIIESLSLSYIKCIHIG